MRGIRNGGSWLVVLWWAAGTALWPRPAAALTPGPTPHPVAPAASQPSESIVARVGTRSISAASFRAAWREASRPAGFDSLTPESARRFLEVLVDRELIAAAAARETWAWTTEESLAYAGTVDRLVVRAALDSVLAETRAARVASSDTTIDEESLGIAARDAVALRLEVRFDRPVLERVARRFMALPRLSSDSSLAAQLHALAALPVVDPADTGAVLAHSAIGPFRVCDLLAHWSRLKPIYRPRIESPEQLEDLVRNGVFERWLRASARERGFEHDPAIQATLRRERELMAVQHLIAREVHEPIRIDSTALVRYYRGHVSDYRRPMRVEVVRMTLPTRSEATRLALRLRDPAQAESLISQGRRQGVRYESELGAQDDSALFRRALTRGVGTVLGPDPDGEAWTVTRIQALLPARTLSYEDVREAVLESWYREESARRLRALLERERRRSRVWIDDTALSDLTDS